MASARRRKRRFGALRGRIPRRSCASAKATSRSPARAAASVRVQSTTSRCAWLPPIRQSSTRTGTSVATALSYAPRWNAVSPRSPGCRRRGRCRPLRRCSQPSRASPSAGVPPAPPSRSAVRPWPRGYRRIRGIFRRRGPTTAPLDRPNGPPRRSPACRVATAGPKHLSG
ncbi:MAG: hypothetical protein QOG73_1432 [Acetobacteraceae bacterium]|nr:hypothetical protein [Acetobacteraceae bacterium]